ncbi:septal ring lytic transglycosylase RlpA family protein [Aquisalimonas sp.]|uniref:septal ring lytic transglycosylase RlpA family protein n=1 Tax=Aquisalimonas sp. TaxID=1872621 RepID=UPI0025BBE9B0|nr:septal ring lytic transglycosylase RlpA family protein [Aquisalimonas sp.]
MVRLLWIALVAAFLPACATESANQPPPAQERESDRGPEIPPDLSGLNEPEPRDEPLSQYGNPTTYEVFGRQYAVIDPKDAHGFTEEGIASWYGKKFHGRRTSSGEPYDMYTLTAAHTQLPLPTYVRVTNLDNDKSVIVRVNDRGPFARERVIDLSYAAADRIGMIDKGTASVRIEALSVTYDPSAPRQANSADEAPGHAAQTHVKGQPAQSALAHGRLLLQVGAFSEQANAEAAKNRLRHHDMGSVSISENGGTYRVRVGPAESLEDLDAMARRLRDAGFNESYVVTD